MYSTIGNHVDGNITLENCGGLSKEDLVYMVSKDGLGT
jgi:hypothetical protein